jgi:hypothetical protein
MMRMSVLALSTLLLGGIALPPAGAEAGIMITTRSGIECVKLGDTTPDILYSGSGAFNDASGTVTYGCPLNGQYLGLNVGYYFDTAYWWVHVDDNNGGQNVSCFLSSCTDAGVCSGSSSRSSSGVGNNQLLSSVGEPFAIGNYTNALMLRCSLPGKVNGRRSGIRKYTLYAFD